MFTQSARYYDAIYSARGKDYGTEAELLHRLVETHGHSEGDALLDVACGTGGHLVFLKANHEVEGIDIDEAMLEIARSKLPGVAFHHADMVDFSLPRMFDAVVCLFSSIAYARTVDGMARTVANMANHAYPGGLVIIEPWFSPEEFQAGTAFAVFVDQPDIKLARMNVSEVEDGLSILDFQYLVASEEGIQHFRERHELALFSHDEYMSAFEEANLEVVHDVTGLEGRGLYIGTKPTDGEK